MGSPRRWRWESPTEGAGDSWIWRPGMADGPVVPKKPGNAGGGKGPWFKGNATSGEVRRLGNLSTPIKVQKLQKALHAKAKAEPGYRFYALYDKLYRQDVMMHAYARCRANKGAAGVDGQTFEVVEQYGVLKWLGGAGAHAQRGEIRTATDKTCPYSEGRWQASTIGHIHPAGPGMHDGGCSGAGADI